MAFDAILAIPATAAGRAVLEGRLGGMPALTRQFRLLEGSGARRLLVVHGTDSDREALSLAINHRMAPRHWEISMVEMQIWRRDEPAGLTERLLVLPAHHVLDRRCFVARRSIVAPDGEMLLWFGDRDASFPAIEAIVTGQPITWPPTQEMELPAGWLAVRNDLAAASRSLWDSCRKPIDGIVSTYLNRPVSLTISRMIVSTPVTPNQITLFSIATGLAGAACVLINSYWAALVGALLLQAASILDGVDGELARIRVQFSHVGEWLDTIGDDVVNIAFILAIATARWRDGVLDVWTILAFYDAGAMVLVAGIYYVWIARAGRGDILSVDWFVEPAAPVDGWRDRIYALGAKLFRRDLLIALFFAAAFFGVLHWALAPIALAATLTLFAQLLAATRRAIGSGIE